MGYRKIIETIELLTLQHNQINSFVNNHPLEINTHNIKFPCVCAYPGVVDIDTSAFKIGIKFFVIDTLKTDGSDEKYILDNTLLILKDFIDRFRTTKKLYGFAIDNDTIQAEPFSQNYRSSEDTDTNDNIAGYYCLLKFDITNFKNECDAPWDLTINQI
jgi:hypothetical protein